MKKLLAFATVLSVASITYAQDSTSTPVSISGSVDTYYKYDFAKVANLGTSFASDQNSVSLGMIDILLKKTTGKASFVGEVSFGPRGQYQSIPNGDGSSSNAANSFHIQNLNATYSFTDRFSVTAGYMGTFVGYEVISPVGNFNYSTSYLFTNGPFQNAGVKANYTISGKVGLMVGLFNTTWNSYQADPKLGLNTFGAQLFLSPVEGWTAYLNLLTGSVSGTILDLTTAYQITPAFKIGLNAADFSGAADDTGFTGVALYPSVGITSAFSFGLRAEYFNAKKNSSYVYFDGNGNYIGNTGPVADNSITSFTLSGNLKAGGLTFIPEIRFDNAETSQFFKENGDPTKSATQFSLAAVYAF